MRVNRLSTAIGLVLIERDMQHLSDRIKQAPGPGAVNTATQPQPCANGADSMTGLPRGGCESSARASGEGFADVA